MRPIAALSSSPSPRKRSPVPLARHFLAFFLAASVVVGATCVLGALSLHRRAGEEAGRTVLQLSRSESAAVAHDLELTSSYLRTIAADPAVEAGGPKTCARYGLRGSSLGLFSPSGRLLCRSGEGSPSARERALVRRVLRAEQSAEQIEFDHGAASLLVAYPAGAPSRSTPSDSPSPVLLLEDPFSALASSLRAPADLQARVTVLDSSDQVVARTWLGQRFVGERYVPPEPGQPGATVRGMAGHADIMASTRVAGSPFLVVAWVPVPPYADQWGILGGGAVVLLLFGGLCLLLSRTLLRPTARLAGAIGEVEWAISTPVPVEGPAEIARIGQAFNDMAGRLGTTSAQLQILRLAVGAASDAILVLDVGEACRLGEDTELSVVYVNDAFAAQSGTRVAPGDLIALTSLVGSGGGHGEVVRLITALQERSQASAELSFCRPDGIWYWTELHVSAVEGGRYLIVVHRDVTARRARQAARALAERRSGALDAISRALVAETELSDAALARVATTLGEALQASVVLRAGSLSGERQGYLGVWAEDGAAAAAFGQAAIGAERWRELPSAGPTVRSIDAVRFCLSADYQAAVEVSGAEWFAYSELRARGRRVGSLAVFGRGGVDDRVLDEGLLAAIAERVALGFDSGALLDAARRELVERQRAEAALGESEERYRQVVTMLEEGIVVVDAEDRVLLANPASDRIAHGAFGPGGPGSLSGGRVQLFDEGGALLEPSQWPARVALREGHFGPTILCGRRAGGDQELWVMARAVRLDLAEGPAAVVSFSDITAARGAQLALSESEARHRAVVEVLAEGVLVLRSDRSVMMSNAAARSLLGVGDDWDVPDDADFALLEDGSSGPLLVAEVLNRRTPATRRLSGLPFREGRIARSNELELGDVERRWFTSAAVPIEIGSESGVVISFTDVTERVASELDLRLTQERLGAALAIGQMTTFQFEARSGVATVVGGTPDTAVLVGHEPLVLQEAERSDLEARCRALAIEGRSVLSFEWDGVDRAGRRIWHEVYGVAVEGTIGESVSVVGVIIDVSEVRRALEDIAVSEERYRRLVEASPVAIAALSGGIVTYANPALEALLGLSEDVSLVGRAFTDCVEAAGACQLGEALQRVPRGQELHREVILRAADGRVLTVELVATAVPGNEDGVQLQARDVSALRSAQRELAASEHYFRSLVERSSDVTLVIGAGCQVQYVSEAARQVFGYSPDEMRGQLLTRYVYPQDLEKARERLEKILHGDDSDPSPVVVRYRHGDGSTHWVAGLATDRRSDRRIGGVVINARDVTAEKTYEQVISRYADLLELVAGGAEVETVVSEADALLSRYTSATATCAIVARAGLQLKVVRPGLLGEDLVAALERTDLAVTLAGEESQEVLDASDGRGGRCGWPRLELRDSRWRNHFAVPVPGELPDLPWGWVITFYDDDSGYAAVELARLAARLVGVAVIAASAREGLARSESRFRAAFDYSPVGMLLLDQDGQVTSANRAAAAMLGYRAEELQQMASEDLVHHHERGASRQALELLLRGASESESLRKRFIAADGHEIDASTYLSVVRGLHGDARYVIEQIEDITLRLRDEQEISTLHGVLTEHMIQLETTKSLLEERNAQLRSAFVQLSRARELERATISQHLHDGSIQALTALTWNMEGAQAEEIPRFREALKTAIDELRQLSSGLVPPALVSTGLVAAIDELLVRAAPAAGLEAELDAAQVPRFDRYLESLAYRTVQEAVQNVVKHARARTVHVRVRVDHTRVEVWVRDDGIGVDPALVEQRAREHHVGVISMQETIALAGGTFHLRPGAFGGTELHFSLPRSGPVGGELGALPELPG